MLNSAPVPAQDKTAETAGEVHYERVRDALAARGIRSMAPKRHQAGDEASKGVKLDWNVAPQAEGRASLAPRAHAGLA